MRHFSQRDRERQRRKIQYVDRATAKCRRERLRQVAARRKPRNKLPALRIYAPRTFNIEQKEVRSPLMAFLAELRSHFENPPGRTLLIDFSKTHSFVATGTLLFYAELTRLIEYSGGQVRLRCTRPANEKASQVLELIGVYRLCEHPSHGKPNLDDVVHWRVARGHDVNNTLCAPAIEAFEGQLAEPLVDGILGGLSEAMTNAVHHAYIDCRIDGLDYTQPRNDWWMFSQARDGYLSVVFCDLGVGIPATLPVKQPLMFRTLERLGLHTSDAACIQEAIKDSRSRTGRSGRGHGLGNIIEVVEKIPRGVAFVFSNRGCYILRSGVTSSFNFKESILGTLIFWRVPLAGAPSGGVKSD